MFNLFNNEKKNLRKENEVLKGKIAILNQENNSLDLRVEDNDKDDTFSTKRN